MKLTWDDSKRSANLAKHGLAFEALTLDFFESATIMAARKPRMMAIGRYNGRLVIVVIFAPLGREALSIISMRAANLKERRLYDGYETTEKL